MKSKGRILFLVVVVAFLGLSFYWLSSWDQKDKK